MAAQILALIHILIVISQIHRLLMVLTVVLTILGVIIIFVHAGHWTKVGLNLHILYLLYNG